ncbi:MAG TPA: hypothetical protein VIM06_07370 [Rhodanobacter sp.]
MNAANQRRLTPVLAVIVLLLGALFLLLLSGVGRKLHWAASRAPAPLPPASDLTDLPRALPLAQFALVWQKPLFSPDRKPIAHAVDGGSNLGDLELTGIILTPKLRMVLLHDKNGDRQLRLHEGEALPEGSVTLVEIRPRSALFDSSAGRSELKLPAGAPFDDKKTDDGAPQAPGDATVRAVPGGAGVRKEHPGLGAQREHERRSGDGHGTMTPPQPASEDHSPASFLERARENAQRRRAARAAASH